MNNQQPPSPRHRKRIHQKLHPLPSLQPAHIPAPLPARQHLQPANTRFKIRGARRVPHHDTFLLTPQRPPRHFRNTEHRPSHPQTVPFHIPQLRPQCRALREPRPRIGKLPRWQRIHLKDRRTRRRPAHRRHPAPRVPVHQQPQPSSQPRRMALHKLRKRRRPPQHIPLRPRQPVNLASRKRLSQRQLPIPQTQHTHRRVVPRQRRHHRGYVARRSLRPWINIKRHVQCPRCHAESIMIG